MISKTKTQTLTLVLLLVISGFAYAADYTYWCEDTDDDDPHNKGSITYGRMGGSYEYNYTWSDYCSEINNVLYERVCVKKNRTDLYNKTISGYYPKTKKYHCECDPEEDVCKSTAVTTTTLPNNYFCVDSDGDEPTEAGSVTYGNLGGANPYNRTYSDYCYKSNVLYERICSGNYLSSKRYDCDCVNGTCLSTPVTTTTLPVTYFCSDPDGDNPYEKSTTNYGRSGGSYPYNLSSPDKCLNNTVLYERVCKNSTYSSGRYIGYVRHTCGNGCENGACVISVTTTTLPLCVDSDNSLPNTLNHSSHFVAGNVTYAGQVYADKCVDWPDPGSVKEYECSNDGGVIENEYPCPRNCSMGACIGDIGGACEDTDGHLSVQESFYVSGTASWFIWSTSAWRSKDDYCMKSVTQNSSDTRLVEGRCSQGRRILSYYACPNGCEDGACVKTVTTPTLPGLGHGDRCVNSSQCAGDLECKTFGDYPHLGRVCCYPNECGSTDGCTQEGTVFFSNMTCVDGEWVLTSCSVPDNVSFSPTQGPFMEGDYLLLDGDLLEYVDAGSGSAYGVPDNQVKLKFRSIDLSTSRCSVVEVVLSAVTSGDPIYTCRGSGGQYSIGDAIDSDENTTLVFSGSYEGSEIVYADSVIYSYVASADEQICCAGGLDEVTFTQSAADAIRALDPRQCIGDELPDLVVEELIWRPASPYPDVNVSVYGRIKNIGDVSSGDFNYAVYIDGNKTKQLPFEPLHPNQTTDIQLAYQPFSLGVHEIKLQLDSLDEVSELNEDNNELTKFMNVTSNPALPDLRVEDIWWTPSNPSAGDDVVFHARIRNIGEAPATSQNTRFYFDSKMEAYAGLVEWLYYGESLVVDSGPWHGFQLTNGLHQVKVTVDGMLNESNEVNNNMTKPLIVGIQDDWCSGADITEDGQVSLSDLSILVGNYNKTGCGEPRWCGGADINQDGKVNIEDLSTVASHYGFTNCTGSTTHSTTTVAPTTTLPSDSPTGNTILFKAKPKKKTISRQVKDAKNCRANNLCGEGEGDCSSNNACEPGLICRKRAGRLYGYSSNVDVCVRP
ncbi:MAG: hypothetical protein GF334_03795 [Candidatus Altiarchaeales archaeon]|nr:hypothetical protein [Candidatus Altiarchaeales archaeon]